MTAIRLPAWIFGPAQQASMAATTLSQFSPTPTTSHLYITSQTQGTGTPSFNIVTGSGGATNPTSTFSGGATNWVDVQLPAPYPPVKLGDEIKMKLPDGGQFILEKDGSYRIEDKDAHVTYKASRVREFNTYLNASDRLEDFIRYCKGFNITQKEMLDLPIKLFIMWLILEAANADHLPPEANDIQKLQIEFKKRSRPRCRCGRFIRRKQAERGFTFCSGDHYNKYALREGSYG